jgi:hypothetical protein
MIDNSRNLKLLHGLETIQRLTSLHQITCDNVLLHQSIVSIQPTKIQLELLILWISKHLSSNELELKKKKKILKLKLS